MKVTQRLPIGDYLCRWVTICHLDGFLLFLFLRSELINRQRDIIAIGDAYLLRERESGQGDFL